MLGKRQVQLSGTNAGNIGKATKVLLVEDEEGYRDLLSEQLSRLGCVVVPVSRASDFLAKIAESPKEFDLAVVDLRLPDLGGPDVISWLDQSEVPEVSEMPILVVTGYRHSISESPIGRRKQIAVVEKPYRFDELENAVNSLRV